MYILAVDPGREKCGLAVMRHDGKIFYQEVVETARLSIKVSRLVREYEAEALAIGDGTTSAAAQAAIKEAVPELKLAVLDEYRTTDEAKLRYWQKNHPRGWRRLLPTTMQSPPEPVDDYVAVILAERYFKKLCEKRT